MFNIALINIEEYYNELCKYLSYKSSRSRCVDQDALNAVFNKKKKLISLEYNFPRPFAKKDYNTCPWGSDFHYARENPVIVHYTDIRPWEFPCGEFCIEWWLYARKTPKLFFI